jgi:hypothetical protein
VSGLSQGGSSYSSKPVDQLTIERGCIVAREDVAGQIPVLEGSEELRLQLFALLSNSLLTQCSHETLCAVVDPLQRVCISSFLSLSHTQAHNEYVPLLLENYIRLDLVDRMTLEGNICNVSIS